MNETDKSEGIKHKMKDDYSDIINLSHHTSATRKHMSMHDRAAQFASFSALAGYDAKIRETARVTDKKIELSEYEIEIINSQLNTIRGNIRQRPKVNVTYFVNDEKKQGGEYIDYTGDVRHINDAEHTLTFTDETKIKFDDILKIEQIDE